jgi:ketosteroid isomerase-like protein
MKFFCLTITITVFLFICLNELQAQNNPKPDQHEDAQSSGEASVRNWYNAFLKLDSTGFFNFWATDHPDFVYVADGKVNTKEDFLKRLTSTLKNTKEMTKATILEGYPHKISNKAYSYTAKAIVEGIYSSVNSFSYTVTATFVLRKINGQWKCVQCSAAHVPNPKQN